MGVVPPQLLRNKRIAMAGSREAVDRRGRFAGRGMA
jgi:hypothetical protein